MDGLLLLALIVFAAGAIVAAIGKAWPVALIAAGLAFWLLATSEWVRG